MKQKRHPNCAQVANDCMIFFMCRHLKNIIADRSDISPALEPLVDAMCKIVERDIPSDVMSRIERTKFVRRMEFEFADHGLCAFNVFKHLTEI